MACFCHGRSGYRKVDDDIHLHIPKMIWWLKMSSLPEKLYDGKVQDGVEFKVIRDPKHEWFVSEQFLNDSWFPPYCNGPFYSLSKSAFLELLKVSSNEGPTHFPLEDANIGILAKRVGTGTILNVNPKLQTTFVLLSHKHRGVNIQKQPVCSAIMHL